MMGAETSQAEDSRYLRLQKQFGKAWDARDIDELMSMMTDDCVYCASVGPEPGTTHVGRDAVREGFLAMLAFDSGGVSRAGGVFIRHKQHGSVHTSTSVVEACTRANVALQAVFLQDAESARGRVNNHRKIASLTVETVRTCAVPHPELKNA